MITGIADKEDLMNAVRDTAARVHHARFEYLAMPSEARLEAIRVHRRAYAEATVALLERLTIGLDLSPLDVELAREPSTPATELDERSCVTVETDPWEGIEDLVSAGTQLTARPDDPAIANEGTQLAARPDDTTIPEAGE